MAAAQASTSGAPAAQEFTVRAPKDVKKKYSIMKFSMGNKVDFTKCGQAKIERENNLKEFKQAYDIDVMPKFGAGSEYGREQREEARRKKYGIRTRRYNPEDQPWLLKIGSGKNVRKFKGTKEGGISENASYYVFTQCPDGAFEAFPVQEWYNFASQIKYKALTSEEAEAEFTRRDKNLNLFSIMVKKRIAGADSVEDPDEEEGKKAKGTKKKKGKDFLLTELDEWAMLSDDGDEDDSDEEDNEDGPSKPKPEKKGARKKNKMSKTNSDDEAVEESDEADETREVDYMTDSESDDEDMYKEKGGDDSDEDKYKEKGVEDEDGLRKALNSDDEEEEEDEKEKKEGEENDEEGNEKDQQKKKEKDSDSESSSGSESDSDVEKDEGKFSAFFLQKKEKKEKAKEEKNQKEKSSSSQVSTPAKATTESMEANGKKRSSKPDGDGPSTKKVKMEQSSSTSSVVSLGGASEGITEDSVRRYLMRKPMTTKELLQKFKSKKNIGLTKDQMVTTIAQILKRLNPEKNKIKDKLYLSIKK